MGTLKPQRDEACSYFLSLFPPSSPAHLEAVERAVIFEGEDVVWDGEEVALGCDQTPDVHGLGCKQIVSGDSALHILSVIKHPI